MDPVSRCEACPCPPDVACMSDRLPVLCEWAASGDSVKVAHVVNRSRIAAGQTPTPEPPTLAAMAGSAASAAASFVASGFKTAGGEVTRERLATCKACEHLDGSRCRLCGCFTDIKALVLSPSCPAGKWAR